MKKNVISLSILALAGLGFAGVANAAASVAGSGTYDNATKMTTTDADSVVVNTDGIGHILLVPYYTVQNGNMTLLSVVNTDQTNGKAVKVRFRGAANSDDVMDFQVFLSPGDVWTANVSQDAATGRASLTVKDNSCTSPPNLGKAAPALFSAARLNPDWSTETKLNNTREGYIEIFNMADIPPGDATASPVVPTSALYKTIKHANGVAACDQSILNPILAETIPATELDLSKAGFNTPTTGLMGTATVINTEAGYVAWSQNAIAVEARVGDVASRGRTVFSGQTDVPVVLGTTQTLTNDPLLRADLVKAQEYDFPDLSTPYYGATNAAVPDVADPQGYVVKLTNALAVSAVTNEYLLSTSIGAETDWTFTMPTRRYYVAVDYAAKARKFNSTGTTVPDTNVDPTAPGAGDYVDTIVASDYFADANTSYDAKTDYICVKGPSEFKIWGRDEETFTSTQGQVTSPQEIITTTLRFCGEVSVFSFVNNSNHEVAAGASDALFAQLARQNIDTQQLEFGWARIPTPAATGNAVGLPVIGASYAKMVGLPVNGVMTNYSIIQPHRYNR